MKDREIILLILREVLYNKSYSNLTIDKYLKKFKPKFDGFIREVTYGVLENKIYLDFILKKTSKIKLNKLDKEILIILRISLYQIYYMNNVPDRASVNEGVNLAKKYGNRGSSRYVNGILRNIIRNKNNYSKIDLEDKRDYLSIKYSHPRWLIDLWLKEYNYKFVEKLCEYNNKKGNFDIRVNLLKTNKNKLVKELKELGYITTEIKYSENSLRVKNPVNIFETKLYKNGYFTVQDAASTIIPEIFNLRGSPFILDACAAPGGKSTYMAEITNDDGTILARDIHKHRLGLIKRQIDRLGIKSITIENHKADCLDKDLVNKIDYCLVDAPCSGFGTIRSNPEIKYSKSYNDIIDLSILQEKILNTVKNYIKIDGILVYSTCTINKIENIEVVNKFLEKNSNFKLDPIKTSYFNEIDGVLKLYPNLHDTNGFFMAKLRRIY